MTATKKTETTSDFECQLCSKPVSEASYDRHDGLCKACDARERFTCPSCGERLEREHETPGGLCSDCRDEAGERQREYVSELVATLDPVAVLVALKRAGLVK